MSKCTFLGLGVMGYPMAGHLAKHGHTVKVWNRTGAKADKWADGNKGEAVEDPAGAVFGSEFVFMCLGDDPDVEAVFDAIEPNLAAGMIVVDHTTASADLARRLHERCKARGATFIDAPISGGQAGAENGKLTIMCGGETEAMEKARPVMKAYGARITHIGESGAGQLAKSVNQICIAGIVQGLSEGIHFAECNGLDVSKVIEAISGGAAQSWQMENRWETMTDREFDHGFAVDWMRKDLRIAIDAARASGASLPLTALVDQYYADIQAMGGNRWDTSSLINRLHTPKQD
ncbi:NAD(P)-dependent oxidoreductase [Henriciella aquimarina]|uniref:NAD(P)-dependent oxidoreductase n=1 Tax=Henriciella aquimarina TaxID=545261 RepID=UPI000A048203|nr:NAD(P)-dependent oxidoreductase [Henriciella aquimarina]